MVKIVAVGDQHFQKGNLVEVDMFISRITELVMEQEPDIIVLLGDLLHTHEKVETPSLNKAYELIHNMRSVAKTYVLVGNHDMCLGKDIPVFMWDGTRKNSQDVCIGDMLVGDDGLSRTVQTVCSGENVMYEVNQLNGDKYTVTENHMLSLKCGFHKSVFWNVTKNAWTVKWIEKSPMKLRSKFFPVHTTDSSLVTKVKETQYTSAITFLEGIQDINTLDISVREYLEVPCNVRDRLYGFNTCMINWESQHILLPPYILGMWLGDGNKDGSGFASADIELIQEWWEWAYVNGAQITHGGQYNFGIRNAGYKRADIKFDICDSDHSAYTCGACTNHRETYGRAFALACASIEELQCLLDKDCVVTSLFTEGASVEQLSIINNPSQLKQVLNWKLSTQLRDPVIPPNHKKSPLRKILKEYGLYNNKHIPQNYLVNSANNRLELLAGFIDTDGCVTDTSKRTIVISQSGCNIHLIDEIDTVAKSLGLSSSKSIEKPARCYTDSISKTVCITGSVEQIPSRLSRKVCLPIANNGIDSRGRKCADKSRTGISVKKVGIGEYYGFSVDGNNRFLLGDCTVTHNCNNQQFLTDNHWLNGVKEWENVVIVDKVVIDEIDGEKLVFVPYVYNGRFAEALATRGDYWMEASCIFAHQEFYGCKMGAKISEEGDKWSLDYPSVISGHIHSRQTPQENVYYPGASMQHAFGESEKNVIACIDVLDGAYTLKEIDIALPRKRTVYVDVTDLEESIPEKTEDKIRIVVSGNPDEFKAMKRTKVFKELNGRDDIKVVFKPKRIELQRRDDEREEAGKTSEDIKEAGVRFLTILSKLVAAESNDYLSQSYRELVQDI
jgi:predicted MPP superfamily phosphohydrolase